MQDIELEIEDDNIDISIEESAQLEGENDVVVEKKKGPSPEDAVAELRGQMEKETAARKAAEERAEAAERQRNEASSRVSSAMENQIQAQRAAIESGIISQQQNLLSLQQQYKEARASGDTDNEVELLDKLNDARYSLNAATWEKKNFESYVEAEKAKAVEASKRQTTPERKQGQFTSAEQAWIDSHPRFNTDEEYQDIVKGAASVALSKGIRQDTPAFFQHIEKTLNRVFPDGGNAVQNNNEATSFAAPASRSGNMSGQSVNRNSKYPNIPQGFKIPSSWVEAAEYTGYVRQDMNEQERKKAIFEYANERIRAEKEG